VVALNKEDAATSAVVEGMILTSDIEARALINPGSTYSFMATSFAHTLKLDDKSVPYNIVVSTPLGKRLGSNVCYRNCDVRLGSVVLIADLIRLPIEDYNAILGSDWLSRHYA
jgi:hypothetical protein